MMYNLKDAINPSKNALGDLVTEISHEEIRKHISLWSRAARPMIREYISQQESKQIKLSTRIRDLNQLVRLTDRLRYLDEQKRINSSSNDIDAIEYLYSDTEAKIKEAKEKLGLPSEYLDVDTKR